MTQTASVFDPTIHPINETATAGPWQLTVTGVELGDAAHATMSAANERNGEAPRDLQWAIAYVKATNSGTSPNIINVTDFAGAGAEGVLYRTPLCAGPDPILQGVVQPGETLEGAVPFWVGDTSNVVLWFSSPLLGGSWADAWFALTDGAAMPAYDAIPEASPLGTTPSAPARFNETVRSGAFDVTLLRYAHGQELYDLSPFGTRALGTAGLNKWHGFLITIRNVSSKPQGFSAVALRLADPSGDPWDHNLQFTPPEPDASRELLPGATHQGWVSIETQDWATATLIRVQNHAVSGDPRYLTPGGGSSEVPEAVTGLAEGDEVTIGETLNLRKEPSANADIVAVINAGTELTITGQPVEADDYLWYPVKVNETGKEGFVVSNYLQTPADE